MAARQMRARDSQQVRAIARDPTRGPIPRPPGVVMSDDRCVCGHRDEPDHEDSWVAPCLVPKCRCLAFDPAPA